MRVSISVVMFFAILIAALTTALVGFIPTYQVGVEGVQDTIGFLRRSVITRIDAELRLFFTRPGQFTTNAVEQGRSGIDLADSLGANSGDLRRTYRYLCGIMRDLEGVTTTINLFNNGGSPALNQDPLRRGLSHICDNRFGFTQVCTNEVINFTLRCWVWNLTTNDYVGGRPLVPGLVIPYDVKINELAAIQREGFANYYDPDLRWQSVAAGYDSIRFTTNGKYIDRNGNTSRLFISILPGKLKETLFSKLELSDGARVLLVDSVSRRIFGTSWGEEPATPTANASNLALPDSQRFIFKNTTDVSDSLIQKVVAELGNGDDAFIALPDVYETTMFKGSDKVYLDVRRFTNPYGLDVRMAVVIPEKDFTGKIDSQQKKTIGGICGALIGMLILAIIFSVLLARPLERLGHRMYLTASLQDSGETEPPSLLSEIAAMQEAYEAMKNELNRMKAYLPQSLLAVDMEDDEGAIDETSNTNTGSRADSRSVNKSSNANSNSVSERASMRSGSSRQSSLKKGAAGVAALKMSRTVATKRVAVLVFNMAQTSKKIGGTTSADSAKFARIQGPFLKTVQEKVGANRGVIDSFQGDRVVATFNAVSNAGAASKCAATCAYEVCQALAANPEIPPITVGGAMSASLVGNMGVDGLLRFNVVGPCVGDAHAMERFARERMHRSEKVMPWCIMLSSDMILDVGLEYLYESVDVVQCSVQPRVACSLIGPKSMSMDEWMYQLEEGEKGDPFQAANDAFLAVVSNKVDEAKGHLDKVNQPTARARIQELLDAPTVKAVATRTTPFPSHIISSE